MAEGKLEARARSRPEIRERRGLRTPSSELFPARQHLLLLGCERTQWPHRSVCPTPSEAERGLTPCSILTLSKSYGQDACGKNHKWTAERRLEVFTCALLPVQSSCTKTGAQWDERYSPWGPQRTTHLSLRARGWTAISTCTLEFLIKETFKLKRREGRTERVWALATISRLQGRGQKWRWVLKDE